LPPSGNRRHSRSDVRREFSRALIPDSGYAAAMVHQYLPVSTGRRDGRDARGRFAAKTAGITARSGERDAPAASRDWEREFDRAHRLLEAKGYIDAQGRELPRRERG
jgi:hypothetical protein